MKEKVFERVSCVGSRTWMESLEMVATRDLYLCSQVSENELSILGKGDFSFSTEVQGQGRGMQRIWQAAKINSGAPHSQLALEKAGRRTWPIRSLSPRGWKATWWAH